MIKEYKEEDYLLLSGIQHFVFCKRQWALIHIEQLWKENLRTIEGKILHEKTHDDKLKEKRGDLVISRGMPVFSVALGLTGTCDVVEFHKDENGVKLFGKSGAYKVIPIEYKRGKPKENDSDILQLCAQAMCIEGMLLCDINEAFLFYGEIRRRQKVNIDAVLREKVKTMAQEMHEYYDRRYTPKVRTTKSCKACSMIDVCMPRLCKNLSAKSYIENKILEVD